MDLYIRPLYGTPVRLQKGSAKASGFDLRLPSDMVVTSRPQVIPLGFALEIEPGYEGQIRPRSSSALKGVAVQFGTIDQDYRGEIGVVAWTLPYQERTISGFLSERSIILSAGTSIAQLVITPLPEVELYWVDTLTVSERGEAGFGSTGA